MTKTITALVPQRKNSQRVSVYIGGKFAFGLAAIVGARLKVGQVLDDAEVARLQSLDEAEEAYNRALSFLAYRPRSRAELERHLREKRVSESAQAQVMARLERLQLVDDASFARFWVENREAFAPRSRRALRLELRQKGLTDERIREALGEVDDERSAYEAGRKRAARLSSLEREAFYRRLSGFLQRRGFDYEVVKTVVTRLWQERDAGHLSKSEESEV